MIYIKQLKQQRSLCHVTRCCDFCTLLASPVYKKVTDIDLNYQPPKFIPVFIHNLSGYDAKANNKYMGKSYDPNKVSRFIFYRDENNLYGWAMSKLLPTHEFKWMNEDQLKSWKNMPYGYGRILEVDLEYDKALHNLHNDYPIAPENITLSDFNVVKLIPNLNNKQNYVVHHGTLKLYESLGLKITKIHRGISFYESSWLKPYIHCVREKRKPLYTVL